MPPCNDAEFVQILDHAFADSAKRAGDWLACRPGCNACCHGVFSISSLDADRLSRGLYQLQKHDPDRAAQIAERVNETQRRLREDYPGNPETGILNEDPQSEERFVDFANEEPCPVLNPLTGSCDLYEYRPVTCRVFGPPLRSEEGLGVCELCFHGAPDDEIQRCELHLPESTLEADLTRPLGSWKTIVAFAFRNLVPR